MAERMGSLAAVLAESDERRKRGAAEWRSHDEARCMLCHAHGEDKRGLFVECFYAIHEVMPEALDLAAVDGRRGYYLRVCKACRGAFLDRMGEWRAERVARRGLPMDHDGHDAEHTEGADIPMRVNGRIVRLTRAEWDARHAATANAGGAND